MTALASHDVALKVLSLGLRPYDEVWDLQKRLHAEIRSGVSHDYLIICQHPPTITVGRGADETNILAPLPLLAKRGVAIRHIERGGDVTYHGPGQFIAYPILNLTRLRQDVGWYMRALEEIVIQAAKMYGVLGTQVPHKTGVWVDTQKIASLGVRISRWCTLHGVAVNIDDCSAGFALINPCGFSAATMTSFSNLGRTADMVGFEHLFVNFFCEAFGYSPHLTNPTLAPSLQSDYCSV